MRYNPNQKLFLGVLLQALKDSVSCTGIHKEGALKFLNNGDGALAHWCTLIDLPVNLMLDWYKRQVKNNKVLKQIRKIHNLLN